MTLPSLKICRRIRQLFRLIGSSNANEAANAREKLVTLLTKHGLSWNDIPLCVAEADAADISKAAKGAAPSGTSGLGPEVNALDLVLRLIELHFSMTPEEMLVAALWALHCRVFDHFDHTPRLVVFSPASGCGKSMLLHFLELLVSDPYFSDNVTAAAVYDELARGPRTLLLDEGDNLGLLQDRKLRVVFNSGHHRSGAISRYVGGRSRRYSLFAPLAMAAIEAKLPLPLLHRSITINMQRASAPALKRLDFNDPSFPAAREQIRRWAATCGLNHDPKLPFHNRNADNWRVLFAIADDLGHGEDARAAAHVLMLDRPEEDPGVVALIHIRTIFLSLGVDRIASKALIEALHALDDDNSMWNEWRGRNDDRPPHKLTQNELSQLLRPFKIKPRTIWPANRGPGSKSYRGYMQSWFEKAWAAYCPQADTPTQSNKIIQLPWSQADT